MKFVAPILVLVASVGLLVLSFVLLPVFQFDTPANPRAAVPSACTEAVGFLLAFLAALRLLHWQRFAAYLLLCDGCGDVERSSPLLGCGDFAPCGPIGSYLPG